MRTQQRKQPVPVSFAEIQRVHSLLSRGAARNDVCHALGINRSRLNNVLRNIRKLETGDIVRPTGAFPPFRAPNDWGEK